jgi:hypothetical protein
MPIRTIEHIKALVDRQADNGSIFGPDDREPMKRWAELFIAYETGGDWKARAKAEYERGAPTFRIIFGEIRGMTFRRRRRYRGSPTQTTTRGCRGPFLRRPLATGRT